MNSSTARSSEVRIQIGAELTVSGLPTAIANDITTKNTFDNPEYARKERLGLWTGDMPRVLRLYRRDDVGLVLPRGTLPIVISTCRTHNVSFRIDDRTIKPPLNLNLHPGVLFDYQARALQDLLRYPTGTLEGPTGCGKTQILLSVIPAVQTPTLILTHTKELLKQTAARTEQWLGVEAGVLGGGKWHLQPISVAMIQTLARRDLGVLAEYFGCVLVDECHHAPAWTWASILNQFPARYRYGFTATAFRKDGLQCLLFRTIGNITARITPAEVAAAGKIIPPTIETVKTQFFYPLEDVTDWTRMIGALIRDEDRNALIGDEVRRRLGPDSRAVILSDRIEHVNLLANRLSDLRPVILTGEMGKNAREQGMTAVRSGARLTIATSSLLGEGVDVPCWDTLFLATPMAGGPRTLQAVGRVTRAAPGKDRALVVDFVDSAVPALACAHEQRERVYSRN